jgi:hypothetical protein
MHQLHQQDREGAVVDPSIPPQPLTTLYLGGNEMEWLSASAANGQPPSEEEQITRCVAWCERHEVWRFDVIVFVHIETWPEYQSECKS